MTNDAPSKKNRRDHARDAARDLREAERKRRVRNRILLQGGIAVGLIAVTVVVVLVVVAVTRPSSSNSAGPANMASGGIEFTQSGADAAYTPGPGLAAGATPSDSPTDPGDGRTHLVEYLDWSCPNCKSFEAAYAEPLLAMVKAGTATIEFRPVAILDRLSLGARYSSRAANVAACVANYDPAHFLDAQNAFYAHQPEENTTGLTDDAILSLLTGAGLDVSAKHADGRSLSDCVDDEQFAEWVTFTTQRASSVAANPDSGGFGTPTVFINGHLWSPSTSGPTFEDAFAQYSAASATPSPSTTP